MAGKSPEFKNKKLYYRRAKWEGQAKKTLQAYLSEAHDLLDTVGKRSFAISHGAEIRGANYKNDNGLYLQIASYIPGEATSIIDKNKAAKQSNISAKPAPTGADYLAGDVFVYINGNHVILCPSGAREKVVETYFWHILRAIDKKDMAKTFELDKVARTSKLRMIKEEGVDEIELNTSLYEASLIHMDKTKPKVSGIKKSIANQVSAIFGKDSNLNEIKERENLNVKVSIKFDGREAQKHKKEPKFGEVGKKRLEKTAEQIIAEFEADNDNGFVIVTGANNRITSEEIRISDSFRIKTLGKSISKEATWVKLKQYYDRLNTEGVFKQ